MESWIMRRLAVSSIAWLGLGWFIILLDLREEILPDDDAKCEVRNRNADDKANDLKNACHLLKRHSPSSKKGGNEAADDHADKSAANRGNDEENEPTFEILKLRGFFHIRCFRPNVNKMSHRANYVWRS